MKSVGWPQSAAWDRLVNCADFGKAAVGTDLKRQQVSETVKGRHLYRLGNAAFS